MRLRLTTFFTAWQHLWGFTNSYCFINVSGPPWLHAHPPSEKETVRHISQANPSGRSVSALLHTLILHPYISLRRAQTSESNLSAKTAIHAGRKNQSHATNALLLISSLFLSPCPVFQMEKHTLLFSTGRHFSWSVRRQTPAAPECKLTAATDRNVFCSVTLTGSPQKLTAFTLLSVIWQMIRRPVRNKNLTMVNDSYVVQSVD